jgi:hypothetical protein
MAEAQKGALLDLDTLVERPRISIDGSLYEILSPDELSVADSHRFAIWGRRIDALGKASAEADEATIEGNSAELEALIAKVARRIAVGVPDDVFAKIPGQQRWSIIDVFTALRLRTQLKVAGAMATATGPTPEWMAALSQGSIGGSSFPGFSGSTADARRTGWRRFLPGLSAPS